MRARRKILATTVLGLLAIGSVAISAETSTDVRRWTAHWITYPDAPVRDAAVFHFRKLLNVEKPPAHFIVHVSADNQFLLYVNQQRVGSGPARSDLPHWRFETYDLGPYLRSGTNLLAATVWNFGVHSALAQMSDRTGFLLQGETETERV